MLFVYSIFLFMIRLTNCRIDSLHTNAFNRSVALPLKKVRIFSAGLDLIESFFAQMQVDVWAVNLFIYYSHRYFILYSSAYYPNYALVMQKMYFPKKNYNSTSN